MHGGACFRRYRPGRVDKAMMGSQGVDQAYLAAEAKARVEIDRQLEACGWLVQDRSELNLHPHLDHAASWCRSDVNASTSYRSKAST